MIVNYFNTTTLEKVRASYRAANTKFGGPLMFIPLDTETPELFKWCFYDTQKGRFIEGGSCRRVDLQKTFSVSEESISTIQQAVEAMSASSESFENLSESITRLLYENYSNGNR